jgi:hypothetical protein
LVAETVAALYVVKGYNHNLSKSCSVQKVIPWSGLVLKKVIDVLLVRIPRLVWILKFYEYCLS